VPKDRAQASMLKLQSDQLTSLVFGFDESWFLILKGSSSYFSWQTGKRLGQGVAREGSMEPMEGMGMRIYHRRRVRFAVF